MTARSWLFVPGDDRAKLDKAVGLGADAIIVDLEDAIPPDGKERARIIASGWLSDLEGHGPEIWVRVNNDPDLVEMDVLTIGRAGIVLPKVDAAAQVDEVRSMIGPWGIVAMIETAAGLLAAPDIAAAPGVTTLMVGEYDLAAELGIDPSPDGRELAPARAAVVVACAAAGIVAPIAPVSADFRDRRAFRASTEALRREGHRGRAVIHPAQIRPANEVFTPTDEEVARARRVLERYGDVLAAGKGVGVDDDGRLIDEAIVRSARQTLATAEAAGG